MKLFIFTAALLSQLSAFAQEAEDLDEAQKTPDVYESFLKSKLPEARECYKELLAKKPQAEGVLNLTWDTTEEGVVKTIIVEKNTTGSEQLSYCLTEKSKAWVFPVVDKAPTKVTYPYSFNPDQMAFHGPLESAGEPTVTAKPKPAPNEFLKQFANDTRQTALDNQKELKACYTEATKNAPDTEGTVVLDWSINENGVNTASKIKSNKTGNKALAECVAKVTKSWAFPAAPKTQYVQVLWPIKFVKTEKL